MTTMTDEDLENLRDFADSPAGRTFAEERAKPHIAGRWSCRSDG